MTAQHRLKLHKNIALRAIEKHGMPEVRSGCCSHPERDVFSVALDPLAKPGLAHRVHATDAGRASFRRSVAPHWAQISSKLDASEKRVLWVGWVLMCSLSLAVAAFGDVKTSSQKKHRHCFCAIGRSL